MPDRAAELAIAERLRSFREWLQIPRSKFAVSVGVGSERLASYEAGRVPLRYEVFREIAKRYGLDDGWLATGRGSPRRPIQFDDSEFFGKVKRGALFSEVFQAHLREIHRRERRDVLAHFEKVSQGISEMTKLIPTNPTPEERRFWLEEVEPQIQELDKQMAKLFRSAELLQRQASVARRASKK